MIARFRSIILCIHHVIIRFIKQEVVYTHPLDQLLLLLWSISFPLIRYVLDFSISPVQKSHLCPVIEESICPIILLIRPNYGSDRRVPLVKCPGYRPQGPLVHDVLVDYVKALAVGQDLATHIHYRNIDLLLVIYSLFVLFFNQFALLLYGW